ncbi:unnamed protein product [Aspergillus oryzae]|uniref:Unnamed protein product n=2 Tax=Aspergillus oryzae TaxID=5062 RepID=A0AAN4YPC5_ASPOZ|nr:unnamed protein product [Aspergillus oryzae]GMF89914.1 unnamed protein product [Aspergillus oryzae]GMG12176.1 unnamed protein product [Aspergillus oryzae]GMG33581.1 unnamed protein product [Aspergillus oryzae]GMG42063.1 unnamed protein product [Aspergillus oryzae var. brunneus]
MQIDIARKEPETQADPDSNEREACLSSAEAEILIDWRQGFGEEINQSNSDGADHGHKEDNELGEEEAHWAEQRRTHKGLQVWRAVWVQSLKRFDSGNFAQLFNLACQQQGRTGLAEGQ